MVGLVVVFVYHFDAFQRLSGGLQAFLSLQRIRHDCRTKSVNRCEGGEVFEFETLELDKNVGVGFKPIIRSGLFR